MLFSALYDICLTPLLNGVPITLPLLSHYFGSQLQPFHVFLWEDGVYGSHPYILVTIETVQKGIQSRADLCLAIAVKVFYMIICSLGYKNNGAYNKESPFH